MYKYYRKSIFVENAWPAKLALFIYVSTHCVETVKWLDYNRYSQLTRWCIGNASALGARGPAFNPRLRQGFLCFIFCFVIVVFLHVLFKNTLLDILYLYEAAMTQSHAKIFNQTRLNRVCFKNILVMNIRSLQPIHCKKVFPPT